MSPVRSASGRDKTGRDETVQRRTGRGDAEQTGPASVSTHWSEKKWKENTRRANSRQGETEFFRCQEIQKYTKIWKRNAAKVRDGRRTYEHNLQSVMCSFNFVYQ